MQANKSDRRNFLKGFVAAVLLARSPCAPQKKPKRIPIESGFIKIGIDGKVEHYIKVYESG